MPLSSQGSLARSFSRSAESKPRPLRRDRGDAASPLILSLLLSSFSSLLLSASRSQCTGLRGLWGSFVPGWGLCVGVDGWMADRRWGDSGEQRRSGWLVTEQQWRRGNREGSEDRNITPVSTEEPQVCPTLTSHSTGHLGEKLTTLCSIGTRLMLNKWG